jgi:hypothetical protein
MHRRRSVSIRYASDLWSRAADEARVDRRREQPGAAKAASFHIRDFVLNQQHQFQRDRANSSLGLPLTHVPVLAGISRYLMPP